MNVYGSGFITIINYASGGGVSEDDFSLITETTNLDILTENNLRILTEAATH